MSRARVADERADALLVLLAVLTAVSAVTLILLAPAVGLDRGLGIDRMAAATVATALLALTFSWRSEPLPSTGATSIEPDGLGGRMWRGSTV